MDHPPPAELPRQQRDELARRHVDSVESWLRKIIHHQLSAKHGAGYLLKEPLIRKEITRTYENKILESPGKFQRDIDTTTFEQAISIITNPELYKEYFSKALSQAYPLGREETRNHLNKLKDIRNEVSHGHGCNARQLEQAICYSNDLIDSIKEYFKSIDMNNPYNAPTIIRVHDSLGNESHLEDLPWHIGNRIIDWRLNNKRDLYPGNTLTVEIEVDQSFDPSTYEVSWQIFTDSHSKRLPAILQLENKHIGETLELSFVVISKRCWHRWYNSCDDRLTIIYRVFPPPAV